MPWVGFVSPVMDGVEGAWARWKAASARPLMAVAMATSCCSRNAKSASIAYGGGGGREREHRAGRMRLGMFSAHVSTCFEPTASPTEKGGGEEGAGVVFAAVGGDAVDRFHLESR